MPSPIREAWYITARYKALGTCPTGGKREATELRSGTRDGEVWIIPSRMAGWINVDACMRFDGNAEPQAKVFLVKNYKDEGMVSPSR